jgi:uncharacterized protein (DUF58 family)
VKIPRTPIRTTWKADWLLEFSVALVALGILTREIIFAAVGIGVLLTLTLLGLSFHRRLAILRRGLHIDQHLPRTRLLLGDSVEGELKIRNESEAPADITGIQGIVEKALKLELKPPSKPLIQPGSVFASTFQILPLKRGRFQISGFRIALTDARRLFTGDVTCGQAGWIDVYPGIGTEEPLTPLALYGGSTEIFRKTPSGLDYAGIREYSTGDELHRIEWKATARLRKLMVKEFHPETETMMHILIDAGRTMHQRSYVGTRLDEALTVAELLVESAAVSGNRVGISIYDETELVASMEPAAAKEQLAGLRGWALTLGVETVGVEPAAGIPPPRTMPHHKPAGERLATFLRLLSMRLHLGYRNAGVYKAIEEATVTGTKVFAVVLTDLETNNEALLEASSTLEEMGGKIIAAEIGATWRLKNSLEDAYIDYERNNRTLRCLERLGVTVLDIRPETMVESIIQEFSVGIGVPAARERSR